MPLWFLGWIKLKKSFKDIPGKKKDEHFSQIFENVESDD